MDDETRAALETIVARIDTMAGPARSADDEVKVIEATADAEVKVIAAAADAQEQLTEAAADAEIQVSEAGADDDSDGALRPESDHWYFRTFGAR